MTETTNNLMKPGQEASPQATDPASGRWGWLQVLVIVLAAAFAIWSLVSHSVGGGAVAFGLGIAEAMGATAIWSRLRRRMRRVDQPPRPSIGAVIVALLALGVGMLGLGHSLWYRLVSCAPDPAADLAGCDLAGRARYRHHWPRRLRPLGPDHRQVPLTSTPVPPVAGTG